MKKRLVIHHVAASVAASIALALALQAASFARGPEAFDISRMSDRDVVREVEKIPGMRERIDSLYEKLGIDETSEVRERRSLEEKIHLIKERAMKDPKRLAEVNRLFDARVALRPEENIRMNTKDSSKSSSGRSGLKAETINPEKALSEAYSVDSNFAWNPNTLQELKFTDEESQVFGKLLLKAISSKKAADLELTVDANKPLSFFLDQEILKAGGPQMLAEKNENCPKF